MCSSRTFHESGVAADHRAVVLFGVLGHQRILFGVEEGFTAVVVKRRGLFAQGAEQLDDGILAGPRRPGRGLGILVDVVAIGTEALEGAASCGQRLAVDAPQVLEHRVHRVPQAVDVEAVETDLALGVDRAVPVVQPLGRA